jgi:hypothetical protein
MILGCATRIGGVFFAFLQIKTPGSISWIRQRAFESLLCGGEELKFPGLEKLTHHPPDSDSMFQARNAWQP